MIYIMLRFATVIVGSQNSSDMLMSKLPKKELDGKPIIVTHCTKQNLKMFDIVVPSKQQVTNGKIQCFLMWLIIHCCYVVIRLFEKSLLYQYVHCCGAVCFCCNPVWAHGPQVLSIWLWTLYLVAGCFEHLACNVVLGFEHPLRLGKVHKHVRYVELLIAIDWWFLST